MTDPLADAILDGALRALRKRAALRRESAALGVTVHEKGNQIITSEARATMLIMAGMPFVVGGALFVVSPKYIGPLFTTPTGQMVAAAAACSMGLGIFIMNKIATIKV